MPSLSRDQILLCRCSFYRLADETTRAAEHALSQRGLTVKIVDDLCLLASRQRERLQELLEMPSGETGRLIVLACRPRTVRWLLHRAGVNIEDPQRLSVLDLRSLEAQALGGHLEQLVGQAECAACAASQNSATDTSWVPWFPVIDYSRCKSCRQCSEFCMFGVYSVSGQGKVEVTSPQACKTNCPACARMCPHLAIIFPKYTEGPISGLEVTAADLERKDLRVSPQELRGGDVYGKLRSRGARRIAAAHEEKPTPPPPEEDNQGGSHG